jgi:hypothetical protein
MFVTGLIRKRMTSDRKISKKRLHNKLKRTIQVKMTRKMRRKKKYIQSSNIQE